MNKTTFKIGIKKQEQAESVKQTLEGLAKDLQVWIKPSALHNLRVYGTASKETYEKLFACELEEKTETEQDFIFGKYERKYFVEKTPAKIPEELKEQMEYVKLDHPIFSPEIKK